MLYYCSKCKAEYQEIPENDKCANCNSRIFYKKREPVLKKIKAY